MAVTGTFIHTLLVLYLYNIFKVIKMIYGNGLVFKMNETSDMSSLPAIILL